MSLPEMKKDRDPEEVRKLFDVLFQAEFFKAAKEGTEEDLDRLLGKGVKIDEKNEDGFSALHIAAMTDGRNVIIDFLCQHGAEVNLVGPSEHVSLKSLVNLDSIYELPENGKRTKNEKAVGKAKLGTKSDEELKNLRQNSIEEKRKGKEESQCKSESVEEEGIEKKLKVLHGIQEEGEEENGREEVGGSETKGLAVAGGIMPIHCAAFIGNSENIFALSRHRANVNALCEIGAPLHIACTLGHLEAARMLVDLGADVNLVCTVKEGEEKEGDEGIYTPLVAATVGGYLDMVRLLLKHGARDGNAVAIAVKNGREDIVEEIKNAASKDMENIFDAQFILTISLPILLLIVIIINIISRYFS